MGLVSGRWGGKSKVFLRNVSEADMGLHCRQAYDGLTKEMEEVRIPLMAFNG